MRDIRFKAWFKGNDKERGGWIQGFNMVNFHNYYNHGIEPHVFRYNKEWKLSEIILCQFTGLYDATPWESLSDENKTRVSKQEWQGVPIYEGDIIQGKPYTGKGLIKAEVFFDQTTCIWKVNEITDHVSPDIEYLCEALKPAHDSKVIGNIFSNPELTKQ